MKSVYTGGEKVAEFESYDELRVGDNKPAFIYEGNELVYPNPVKDGLVLWYDFSGRTNKDGQRGIAEDLSGNGNHGTLQNFNFTHESGYDKNKLLFDGVDDYVEQENMTNPKDMTISVTLEGISVDRVSDIATWETNIVLRVLRNSGKVSFIDKRKSPDRVTSDISLDPTKKTHILIVVGLDNNEIYINGQFSARMESSENGLINVMNPLQLGSIGFNNPYFLGGIADFKIYNRPLTPEEITHNYAIEKERFGIK